MEVCAFNKFNKFLRSIVTDRTAINADFFFGDYLDRLKDVITALAPSGKLLLVSKEDTFIEYGKAIINACNEVGSKLINIVIDRTSNTIENSSVLFSAPEDIRGVIVLDSSLFDLVGYYASLRNLPVVVIPIKLEVFGLFNKYILIRANGSIDKVLINAKRHIILDNRLIFENASLSNFYASIISKSVSLFDYKIYTTATNKQFNKTAYDLYRNGIFFAIELSHKHVIAYKERLLDEALIMEVANCLADGEISLFSAEKVASALACKNRDNLIKTEFFASMTIISLYGEFFKSYGSVYSIVDYTSRVEYACKNLNIDNKTQLLNSFLMQSKNYSENVDGINKLLKSIYQGAQMIANNTEKIVKRFYLLGGDELDENKLRKLKQAIRYSGDFPFGFNGATLLREKGILDL